MPSFLLPRDEAGSGATTTTTTTMMPPSSLVQMVAEAGSDPNHRCILRIPVAALAPAMSRVGGSEPTCKRARTTGVLDRRCDGYSCSGEPGRGKAMCDGYGGSEGCGRGDCMDDSGSGSIVCTLESLLDDGLPGLILPLRRFGMAREDVAYFLRDMEIHAINVDMRDSFSLQSGSSSSASCRPRRHAKRQPTLAEPKVNEKRMHENTMRNDRRDNDAKKSLEPHVELPTKHYAEKKEPAFDNVCGSAFVHGYHMHAENVPYGGGYGITVADDGMMMMAGGNYGSPRRKHAMRASASAATSSAAGLLQQLHRRRQLQQHVQSGFDNHVVCVFSAHGNLTLRRHGSGAAVTFKVHSHVLR